MDIESNKSDYEYYFNAGQQSKQAEVDELQKRIDRVCTHINPTQITQAHHYAMN